MNPNNQSSESHVRGQRRARGWFSPGARLEAWTRVFIIRSRAGVYGTGHRWTREQKACWVTRVGNSRRQEERKSPAKSEHSPRGEAFRRYLLAPRHSPELSEPRSETPYEGILEDPPGCRDPTRGQIRCRGWGLRRAAGSRWDADPPERRESALLQESRPTLPPVLNAIQQFLSWPAVGAVGLQDSCAVHLQWIKTLCAPEMVNRRHDITWAHTFVQKNTFWAFLLELHFLAILLQILVCELVEGVWSSFTDDDPRLVLLLNDGFRCGH